MQEMIVSQLRSYDSRKLENVRQVENDKNCKVVPTGWLGRADIGRTSGGLAWRSCELTQVELEVGPIRQWAITHGFGG
jgi:hypothetical protein